MIMSLLRKHSVTNSVLQLLILLSIFLASTEVSNAQQQQNEATSFQDLSNSSNINSTYLNNTSDTVDYNDASTDGLYGYQKHPSRIAAVVVYCVAAFIGIFGVLIKYFVMQYERSQAQAQLEYQQLQSVKTY